ncbi:hypothetical protein NQ315_006329 [Exocentrus adspersus]|uniref:Large proline-rich protein BAG6 n=1 Tax=Exocentrus adspersus TaxID=1586481 RepID=A0AAV8W0C8_9CUCU|nr:hypothetical protein NQ315_006329 [Exocentrus adspersus]
MIELTVKTLDSQNHHFSVEDDITVEQFKAKIAETVNIPPETQRIIYCGRVLQDTSKLADYDVNGKVVHLVQRAPPGSTPRPSSRSSSPQPQQRRGFRGFRRLEQANAMYLGSMAFPGNLMESQGIVPPPPTHSLSGSRLNVAKRMLRRAEAIIQLLENPSARSQDQTPPEENQEEVTPVIEARVIVPSSNNEPIDEAMVLNAVQNTLINAVNGAVPFAGAASAAGGSGAQSSTESTQRSPNQSESSTPGGITPRYSSTENLAAEARAEGSNGLPENASRTSEMADLLTMLAQLQTRFAPFLERYQNFMQEDPEVTSENERETQVMLNRVSEVLHFMGHAYHSLSDIIVRVRTPPPRPLLCRPILIQHSAVVQTGIPIQVEAQINVSADRPPTTNAGANQTSTTNAGTTSTTTPNANGTTPAANGGPTISVQPGFVGLPFLPGAAMRVQSFPVEIRTVRPNSARPQNNNNNRVNTSDEAPVTGNATTTTTSNTSAPGPGNNPQDGSFNFNNPNVEFFMEVTPEGITIDSLETTLVGSNQANDLLRGALNGPPPEFLQSLMQMAGQMINRQAPPSTTAAAPTTDSAQSSTQQPNAVPVAGQNSQARGNTQTNPTTATHTRSTPRPHVQLAQQAVQGGFDPFLPCNSHHISRRRLYQASQAPAAAAPPASNQGNAAQGNGARQETPQGGQDGAPGQNQNILNFINGIFDTIRSEYRRSNETAGAAAAAPNTSQPNAGSNASTNAAPNLPPFASLFSNLQGMNLPDLLRQGPTLDQLLQQFHQDDQYVQGESVITDLIMLFVRNLTLVDLFTLNSGNVEPINRNRVEIQNFFRLRICEGDTSPAGVDRGVDRVIAEMQPFLENFRSLPVQGDIDMVRSAEQLFRHRLPNIINIAVNLNPNSVRLLLDQCITTAQQLFALTLTASANGQQGVEQVFEQIMNRFMTDVPQEIQNWTLMTSRMHLRQVMSGLSVPESVLQPYLVRKSQASLPSAVNRSDVGDADVRSNSAAPEVEAMELDEPVTVTSNELGPTSVVDDAEPLPNIVIGSEPWHGQVPEDWVPIIARDAQKQRRQNPQGPFSDAYLSGMPSKRRKIVASGKPQGSLPQVITESVRQAVTATGLSSVAPLETVAQAAGASTEIQAAYRSLLRSNVQANLRDNEDFTPERFPNAAHYFNSNS